MLQIYVDDIIFGSTNQDFCEEFGKMMTNEFEMSMIGELSYFLGLQIKKLKNDTFVSQCKKVPLLCDNESAIKLVNNPVQHVKTKHI